MGEIKRIGPPTPINGRGSEYDLSVPLNATPSQLWRRAFQAPDHWKDPFHPSRITIKDRALLFTSEDCRVQLWMALIDKWIASANERGRAGDGLQGRTTGTEGVNDRRRGLQEGTMRQGTLKREESYASKASGSAKSTHAVEAKQAGPQEH
jgi:hypothetical protein